MQHKSQQDVQEMKSHSINKNCRLSVFKYGNIPKNEDAGACSNTFIFRSKTVNSLNYFPSKQCNIDIIKYNTIQ